MRKNLIYFFIFLALSVISFYPVFTDGRHLAIGDGFYQDLPLRALAGKFIRNGIMPFWNPYMFSGTPLLAAMQPAVLYPFNVLFFTIFEPFTAYNLNIIVHYALAGFFLSLYLRLIGVKDLPAFLGGVVFGFMGFLHGELSHVTIQNTAVWLPIQLYFFEKLRQNADIKYAFGGALAVALQIFAGHAQIFFYSFIVLLFFVLFHSLHLESGRRSRFIFYSAILLAGGMLLASPQLAATSELKNLGERAVMNIKRFSQYHFPLHMLPTFIFPSLYGGYNTGFMGILPLMLAFACFIKKAKANIHVKFWGFLAIAASILMLGGTYPFNRIMFHIPGFNLFRVQSRNIYELDMAIAVLFSLGIGYVLYEKGEKSSGIIKAVLIALTTIIALTAVSLIFLPDFLKRAAEADGLVMPQNLSELISIKNKGIYIPVIIMLFYALSFGLIKKFKRMALCLVFCLFLFEIVSPKSYDYPKISDAENYFSEIFTFIKKDSEISRTSVMSREITNNLWAAYHGIGIIEGYDPFILRDYANLLDMNYTGLALWDELIRNNNILSMLNVKYLIVSEDKEWLLPGNLYSKVLSSSKSSIYINKNCLPRAFSLRRLVPVSNTDKIKARLYFSPVDPRIYGFVSEQDFASINRFMFSQGELLITGYEPNTVNIKTSFPDTGFAVLADQYYPGWKAFIDGKKTEIYKTNGILRGVIVPKGEHKLVFKYMPYTIYLFFVISILTFTAFIYAVLYKQVFRRRRANES